MSAILPDAIDLYLTETVPPRDALVAELERDAAARNFPIIGPQVGRLLALLAGLTGARQVFELGSGFGYSAYWFARAMAPGGRVICTDRSEENAQRARELFQRADMAERLDFRVGDSIAMLEAEKGLFDIILIDLDKEQYPRALDVAINRTREGGLIVADNLLWSGKVVTPDPDPATRAILEYTRRVIQHPDLHSVVLPIRDGVGVSWKRARHLPGT